MNYPRIYQAFIADRRSREDVTLLLESYTEKHHILPRALGGGDEPANLIRLIPEDHFFAHLLLAKIHGGKHWLAVVLMTASHAMCYGQKRRLHGFAARAAQRNKAPDGDTKARMLATQQRKAPRFDFVCLATGEEFRGTTLEFQLYAGVSQASASKLATERARTAQGWALLKNKGMPVGKRDLTRRVFQHKNGDTFEGTTYDFRNKFDVEAGLASRLVSGAFSTRSIKGWRYAGEKAA